MEKYLEGTALIGDDYSLSEITSWYNDEKEGYAGLVDLDLENGIYPYHAMNRVHCFNYLPKDQQFDNALGLGSAFGQEFLPLSNRITKLTILEPSANLRSDDLNGLKPAYLTPNISGKIDFPDHTFDLITSFGVLHHIPNVSFVVQELLRVLAPGGYLLVREPIVSMGDWRQPRHGLTQRERGIPVHLFDRLFNRPEVEVVNKNYLTCMSSFIQAKLGFLFPRKLISYQAYIYVDKWLAALLRWNIRYHHSKFQHKLAPQNVAYVIRKLP